MKNSKQTHFGLVLYQHNSADMCVLFELARSGLQYAAVRHVNGSLENVHYDVVIRTKAPFWCKNMADALGVEPSRIFNPFENPDIFYKPLALVDIGGFYG